LKPIKGENYLPSSPTSNFVYNHHPRVTETGSQVGRGGVTYGLVQPAMPEENVRLGNILQNINIPITCISKQCFPHEIS
jgi:hypothetical protein